MPATEDNGDARSLPFHLLGCDDGSADHWTGENRNANANGGHAFFSDSIQIVRLDGGVDEYDFEASLTESSRQCE
jgi:hypothetical protein